jgi:hypothetical protein
MTFYAAVKKPRCRIGPDAPEKISEDPQKIGLTEAILNDTITRRGAPAAA